MTAILTEKEREELAKMAVSDQAWIMSLLENNNNNLTFEEAKELVKDHYIFW